jgi:TRAP-type C4-dicarboxylate transport system permease small subunit
MSSFDRWFGQALRVLCLIGGLAILFMMLVTVADVAMRYLFNSPIKGTLDLTQMAMSIAVFLALAYCGWTGGHIFVDVLAALFPRWLARSLAVFVNTVGGAFMLGVAWQSALAVADYATTGEVSFTLHVPLYPFFAVVAFGSLAYAVVLGLAAAWPDRPPHER